MEKKQHTISSGNRLPADERRLQLTEATLRVFFERGFSGATTKEIAQIAGISKAVIYQHFDTKEELYRQVLKEKTRRVFSRKWLAEIREYAESKDDVRLFEAIAAKVAEFAEQNSLVRLVLYSALEGHEIIQEFCQRQMLPVFELLRDYIEKRQADDAFQMCDANLAARSFLGAQIYHTVVENLFNEDPFGFSKETAIKNYTQLALDGLRKIETKNFTTTL